MDQPAQTIHDASHDETPSPAETRLVDALKWLMSATGGQYVCRVQFELACAPGGGGFVVQYWAKIQARWIEPVLGWGESPETAAADAHRIFEARCPDRARAARGRTTAQVESDPNLIIPAAQTAAPAGIESQAAVESQPESNPATL